MYSSLNYKDALAVTGRGKIIRVFPMVCGIDLAGRIVESRSPEFAVGDEVQVVGQGLGETVWGGYSHRARVPAHAALRLPAGLGLKEAMAIGTAGFTAMLSLIALEHQGIVVGDREVVVTGAAGGVGSIAVALLSGHGYRVAASTGRAEAHTYLRELGATTIIEATNWRRKVRRSRQSAGRGALIRSEGRRWRRFSPPQWPMAPWQLAVWPAAPTC